MPQFGLASRLDPKTKIFYSYLSSTRHTGRVTDLITANFKLGTESSLKVRLCVSLASSFGFLVKSSTILVESAMEGAELCFSVQIGQPDLAGLSSSEIEDRLAVFDEEKKEFHLLTLLKQMCDGMSVVLEPVGGRLEISFKVRLDGDLQFNSDEITIETFDANVEAEIQGSKQYVELGDLPFEKLLAQDTGRSSMLPPLSGEFVAQGLATEDIKTLIKGTDAELMDQTMTTVSGSADEDLSAQKTIIGGMTDRRVDEKILVSGGEHDAEDLLNVTKVEQLAEVLCAETQRVIDQGGGKELQSTVFSNMLKELMEEKSKLVERSRSLNHQMKQKELAFGTRERALGEEVKRKEEQLKQRTSTINHLKEQFTKLMGTVEKLKMGARNADSDNPAKQKYNDLKAQFDPIQKEKEQISMRAEKLVKQLDEFKRVNRQLMDRIAKIEKKRMGTGNPQLEDMKKRMSQLMQVSEQRRTEAEGYKQELDEMRRELRRRSSSDDSNSGETAA